jgi:hypothetical protein
VRTIDAAGAPRFLLETGGRRACQLPANAGVGRVKSAWRPESLGWFSGSELVGTALVLHRDLPALPLLGRRSLAYIPEGPTVDWFGSGRGAADWLDPLIDHLRSVGVFSVKLGPKVVARRWTAETVKAGMADPASPRSPICPPTTTVPRRSGSSRNSKLSAGTGNPCPPTRSPTCNLGTSSSFRCASARAPTCSRDSTRSGVAMSG